MPPFSSVAKSFATKGINLRYPVDKQPDGYLPYLLNLRSLTESTLQPRNGTKLVGSTGSGVEISALRRLNNLISGEYTRIMVSGGHLYSGTGAFTSRDTGYTGNSALVPFRPDQSPEPWMYVADATRMRKVRTDGTNYQMGVTPPLAPPVTGFGVPAYNVVEAFEAIGAWTPTGTAGAISTPIRINTVINNILYDSGTTGWAVIHPNQADSNLQPGMFITVAAAERIKVHDVFQPITTSTVAAISYDVGTTGLCCVQLAGPSSGLVPNCMVQIGSEQVRVRSVTLSASGIPSFRCNASATHAAGDTVLGLVSFRAYTVGTRAVGNTLVKTAFQSTVAAGIGVLSAPSAINLNVITGGLPLSPEDYIHISVLVDNPNNVVAGRIYFDVDATTNDFQHNAYYYEFRPSDFQASVSNQLTALTAGQLAIQRQIITQTVGNDFGQYVSDGSGGLGAGETYSINTFVYDPGQGVYVAGDGTSTTSVQQIPGNTAWTELVLKVSDLLKGRIGSDQSRSLANVAVLGIQLNCTDTTVLLVDSWWVGGGYGLDVGATGSPVLHAYRYRSSLTGAVSNNSPVVRSGLNPMRERVAVSVTASADPQVDKIDVFHFGGGLDEWRQVAVAPNTTGVVNDDIDALTTAVNQPLPFDDFLPFPTSDIPKIGTCNVSGTTIDWVSGDKFNVKWAPGSSVIINGVNCTLYGSPISITKLYLVESAGSGSGQAFLIPEATIQGNPLLAMWGPFGGTDIGNVMFAVGDINQPGNLYWTKPGSPDTASDAGYVEVTSPSEPLINGFTYDSKAYVYSSERLFAIFSNINATTGQVTFTCQEIPNGKGLIAKNAVCVGPRFWAVSRSGIWESSGGEPTSITNDTLYPLFPHEGAQPTASVNGVQPPDYSHVESMRLCYADSSLYFLYVDITGGRTCLRYDIDRQGWFPYDYTPTLAFAYQEEGDGVDSVLLGSITGTIAQIANVPSDAGTAIHCKLLTAADTLGDLRLNKLYGDLYLDLNAQGADVTITPFFNEFTTSLPAYVQSANGRAQIVEDFLSGDGFTARDISLTYEWTSATAVPILYGWSYSYVPKVEDTLKRATDYDTAGTNGWKFVQGMRLTADTQGLPVTLQIQGDSGAVGVLSLAANHNGQVTIPYSWPFFFAHEMRIVPSGNNPIRIYSVEWIYEPAPDLATIWQTQGTTHDLPGFHHHRDAYIAVYAPTGGTINLSLIGSQATTNYSVNIVAGRHQRIYLPLAGNKSLLTGYTLTADFPFGVYKKDCEMRVKAWGDTGPFIVKNPFGDISRVSGATI